MSVAAGQGATRPYHHGNLAEALVAAGLELAAEGGPDAVVLREVARRVGVSATAAYRHFDGQAGLSDAIKQASLGRLALHMRQALEEHERQCAAPPPGEDRPPDPYRAAGGLVPLPGVPSGSREEYALRRLEAIGRAYFDFAMSQPGLFRCFCMGLPVSTPESPLIDQLQGEEAYSVLTDVLDELVAAGVLTQQRRDAGVDIALWSAIHGLAILCMDGPLAELSRGEQESMLTTVEDVLLHGIAG